MFFFRLLIQIKTLLITILYKTYGVNKRQVNLKFIITIQLFNKKLKPVA